MISQQTSSPIKYLKLFSQIPQRRTNHFSSLVLLPASSRKVQQNYFVNTNFIIEISISRSIMHCRIKTMTPDQLLQFQSRESALAVKQFVKNLFISKYIYPEPALIGLESQSCNAFQKVCNQAGPSFFRTCANSPAKLNIPQLKKTAFVTQKMSEKCLTKTKREIQRTKQQTALIQKKMLFSQNPIKIANIFQNKMNKRGTFRSTTTEATSRKLFKNSFTSD